MHHRTPSMQLHLTVTSRLCHLKIILCIVVGLVLSAATSFRVLSKSCMPLDAECYVHLFRNAFMTWLAECVCVFNRCVKREELCNGRGDDSWLIGRLLMSSTVS